MTGTAIECRFCGHVHGLRCPSVKAIEYYEDGKTVRRVEFMTAEDYPAANLPPLKLSDFGHWPTTWGNPSSGPSGRV